MRILTDYQKEFLLSHFFRLENVAGWKNIATKLLENGRCTVAGTECIWKGGIGNFIKLETADNLIDCVIYEFDLEMFLSSRWYKQISENYLSNLSDKLTNLQIEHADIQQIVF